MVGDVAGRVDALDVGPASLVDEDAVVDLDVGAGDGIGDRLDADADDDDVGTGAARRTS